MPVQFRHYLKVHAVDAGYKRWRQKDDRDDGKDLDNLVLFTVDKSNGDVEQGVAFAKEEVGVLDQRLDILDQALQDL